jgi:hypothetical protein
MPETAEKQSGSPVEQALEQIGPADIVLGIPTHNHRETVALAAQAGIGALRDRFPGIRAAIVNADGNSQDGTPDYLRQTLGDDAPLIQLSYALNPVERLSVPLAGVPGRREAALTIFRCARQLGAKACALLDADVESVTPEWVDRLARPVLDGTVDLVAPSYQRRKFQGLISSGVLTPFARALFGKRLRQPMGADMAFSGPLMDFYIAGAGLNGAVQPSADPWSAIPAITNGFQVGQGFLGPRKVRARDVPPDLSGVLQQVLAGIFEQMEHSAAYWQKIRGSEASPEFGVPTDLEDGTGEWSRQPMYEAFRKGCRDLGEIFRLVLPPAALLDLQRLERQPEQVFRVPDEFWSRVVYDFAIAYHLRVVARDHLLRAITPLYLGWAASFTGEMENSGGAEVERRLEELALQFEAQKRYFISRWRWPDRFSP